MALTLQRAPLLEGIVSSLVGQSSVFRHLRIAFPDPVVGRIPQPLDVVIAFSIWRQRPSIPRSDAGGRAYDTGVA